ncbi:MAG: VWA domain-containing protein [Bacteroidota bacterium]
MSPLKRVNQELANFILFGGVLTPELRKFTAELVFLHLYDESYPAVFKLSRSPIPQLFPRWFKLLERLLGEQSLKMMTLNNEDFSLSVAREMLNWCEETHAHFLQTFSLADEEKELQDLEKLLHSPGQKRWNLLLDYLQQHHPSNNRDWRFYQQALKRLGAQDEGGTVSRDREVIRKNILRDWRGFIRTEKSEQEAYYLESAYQKYRTQLSQKINQLQDLGDLLSPFFNFLGNVWNDAVGNWDRIDWKGMESYAHQLSRDRHLRELAEMLGKWTSTNQALKEMQAQALILKRKWRPNPYGKSEIVGIHHSDHLGAMLPSEVALLSSAETEILLAKKYVEKKLLTFQYRSHDAATDPTTEEVQEKSDEDAPGPFVLIIDTSGSMFGDPERIAKALALAILEIAIKTKRQAFLISFSTGIQTTEMTGMETDLTEMVDFLRMSFHGGTDIQPAIGEAMKMLKREAYQSADVLIISDFVIPRLDRKIYEEVMELRRQQGTHFHSLYITRRADTRALPLPIFDHHWVYDMDNPELIRQAIDHFQTFEEAPKE